MLLAMLINDNENITDNMIIPTSHDTSVKESISTPEKQSPAECQKIIGIIQNPQIGRRQINDGYEIQNVRLRNALRKPKN